MSLYRSQSLRQIYGGKQEASSASDDRKSFAPSVQCVELPGECDLLRDQLIFTRAEVNQIVFLQSCQLSIQREAEYG